ncbi:mastermind-like protein 2 [Dasypus novemcinctus]|uniref:mastermind-like protein 2 n=1 Tax=Dasypus novemcinctus TaxID=9361 RepID=UPI00265EB487|nr:mastermind-like protein 2 [Dasypus novemcinctus]
MGDTAPPQAPAGGLGGAPGAGLLGGGAGAPRVHSAIVERLRARIAVCRQHHLSCEGRYERGRAESSDRERESTLQLLSLVQHGQGARKAGKQAKAPAAAPPPAPAAPPAAAAPPPDYHRHQHLLTGGGDGGGLNGEQQAPASTPADQRNSALMALQGSLRRKQGASLSPAASKRPNGFAESPFLDVKRLRGGENLPVGHGGLHVSNGHGQVLPGALPLSQAPLRSAGALPPSAHAAGHGLFDMGLKEVKKEPGETRPCSKHTDGPRTPEGVASGRFGEAPGEQLMDPELQELFNELTNISVPPMSDLELENMINATIKQDDPFGLDLGQQSQRSAPRPSLPGEKMVIKSEFSPGLAQGPAGSPQLRPPSAGPTFAMASSALSTSSPIPAGSQSQAQPPAVPAASRALGSWQEVSHAQQLKQIAANRQQHARVHQPGPWPALPSAAGPSPGPFGQEKMPSPSFGQQPFSPQSASLPGVTGGSTQPKVLANYMYKSGPAAQGGHADVLMQQQPQDLSRSFISSPHLEPRHGSTKPLFHFSSDPATQQVPSLVPAQGKPSLLHYAQQPPPPQSSLSTQQPPQPAPQPPRPAAQPTPPLSSQALLRSPLPLQQKLLLQKMQSQPLAGLGYQVSQQHRQDQHSVGGQNTAPSPSPNPCSNPSPGGGYMNPPQSLLNQQLMGKKQTLQRQVMERKQQLLLQQQMLVDSEKIAPQDQINRHLTRPPPDYKDQRRNVGSMQPTAQYSGGSPAASLGSGQALASPVSAHSLLPPGAGLLPPAHGPRTPAAATTAQSTGVYGHLPCGPPGAYGVASGMAQQRAPHPLLAHQGAPMPRAPALGPSGVNGAAAFAAGPAGNAQPSRPSPAHGLASVPAARTPSAAGPAGAGWASPEAPAKPQEALKLPGAPFPAGAFAPGQASQPAAGCPQFPPRAGAPAAAVPMRPPGPASQAPDGPGAGPLRALNLKPGQLSAQILPGVGQAGTALGPARTGMGPALPAGAFPTPSQSARPFPAAEQGGDVAFDFLSQQVGLGPALGGDADFLDSLLKTEPGNDDWMKDINLDEILGSN